MLYNKIQSKIIIQYLKTCFSDTSTIVNIICDYLWDVVKIKVPLSIYDAVIDASCLINNKNIFLVYSDILTIEVKENMMPDYIEYIGKNQYISIQRDISESKYDILKSVLGYQFDINYNEYNIDNVKISLHGLVKYKIPLLIDRNQIRLRKKPDTSFDQKHPDYVFVESYKNKNINEYKNTNKNETETRCKIKKNVCGLERFTNKHVIIKYNRKNKIITIKAEKN